MVASVRHFGFSRSSGLAPSRVYFDDSVFKRYLFFKSGERFRMATFSVIVFGVVVWTGENDTKTISVDANLFENGLVWTGPE